MKIPDTESFPSDEHDAKLYDHARLYIDIDNDGNFDVDEMLTVTRGHDDQTLTFGSADVSLAGPYAAGQWKLVLGQMEYEFQRDVVWIEGTVGEPFSLKFGQQGIDSADNTGADNLKTVTFTSNANNNATQHSDGIRCSAWYRSEGG